MHARGPIQQQDLAVVRVQPDRLVGTSRQQRLQVRANGRQGRLDAANGRRYALVRLGLPALQQLFDRFGHQRNAPQVQQLQRAVALVYLVTGVAQAVQVLLVAEERPHTGQRVAECGADFVDDPGERRHVLRGANELVWIVDFGHQATRKRATEAFSSRARVASCPIDCAV